MVVVISNSGAVARPGEAVQFVNAHGGFTVGITSDPESVVGKQVQRILKLDIPAFESSPCLHYAKELNRPLMIVTDGGKETLGTDGIYIRVPGTESQTTMPLTQFVPTALLAGYLAEFMGESYGRGAEGPWAFAKDGSGVRNSEIVVRRNVLK